MSDADTNQFDADAPALSEYNFYRLNEDPDEAHITDVLYDRVMDLYEAALAEQYDTALDILDDLIAGVAQFEGRDGYPDFMYCASEVRVALLAEEDPETIIEVGDPKYGEEMDDDQSRTGLTDSLDHISYSPVKNADPGRVMEFVQNSDEPLVDQDGEPNF